MTERKLVLNYLGKWALTFKLLHRRLTVMECTLKYSTISRIV